MRSSSTIKADRNPLIIASVNTLEATVVLIVTVIGIKPISRMDKGFFPNALLRRPLLSSPVLKRYVHDLR